MGIRKWFRRIRDAITGRYATEDYAKSHPESTIVERHRLKQRDRETPLTRPRTRSETPDDPMSV